MIKPEIIDLDEVRSLVKRLKEINAINLLGCDFLENGKPVAVDLEVRREFKFAGLNNQDFIMLGFYKNGWDAWENDF